MTRLHIKKNQLIAVAGVVWLLAGLNVAVLGVRAAIHMSGAALLVALALAAGSIVIFCAFHAQTRQKELPAHLRAGRRVPQPLPLL